MDWLAALFSFRGRVSRTAWWIAAGLVGSMTALDLAVVSEESLVAAARLLGRSPAALFLVWGLVALWWAAMAWILAAASVRRFHDRGLSGWRLVPFVVPAVLAAHWVGRFWPAELAMIAALAALFVELGLMPGETRPLARAG